MVILLNIAGRTLNVVSLAGLAFATGMVLDAAIVCFENILRLRERGMPAAEASQKGTDQVWGALLASTATNVAIFLPVIFLKDVEGQLFADLALTIAFAVFVSLIVAITVVPVASRAVPEDAAEGVEAHQCLAAASPTCVMNLTDTPRKRQLWIGGLIVGSLVGHLAADPQPAISAAGEARRHRRLHPVPRRRHCRFCRQELSPNRSSTRCSLT